MKTLLRRIARPFGYDVVRRQKGPGAVPEDFTDDYKAVIERVRGYTQTSHERIGALLDAIGYLEASAIEGDIVECGVWRGGSMMAAALALLEAKSTTRSLYLFDTFEGMPPPTELDVDGRGKTGEEYMAKHENMNYVSLEEVRANLAQIDYPAERVHFVKGMVEDTIPDGAPDRIALLRLDTDWYESTKHELEQLFPRIVPGGVLIIDDYGHFKGCRKAVDEYFASQNIPVLLSRIDYTGRIAVKR